MATGYSFVSHWLLEAPVDAVWGAIYDAEKWPRWWKYVRNVMLLQPGDGNGVGAVRRTTWTTALPYSFTFDTRSTRVERPRMLDLDAFGDLEGTGHWELATHGDLTEVRYDWNVRTNKPWMNDLAPLLRPAFAWNHDVIMTRGGRDLARYLGVRLVCSS
jgi:uncharacterized protein YndB with AHSA1/START domain